MTPTFDAVILGAGAAGLMCAIEAGKRGNRVAVLEQADRAGKKILISGGGRCNFTNVHCTPDNFLSSNEHFAKSALARYTPADFIALIDKHRIPYHEKTLGQLFCDRSAHDVMDMLHAECRAARVEILLRSRIQEVRRADSFEVRTDAGNFCAPALVVATGGLSIPKMGATSLGYDLARQFGVAIRKTRPGLVPLVFAPNERTEYCDLAGVACDVVAAAGPGAPSFRESMLITHRGMSGPAILQASSYWNAGEPLRIDLAPGADVTSAMRETSVRNTAMARAALQRFTPLRFAKRWTELHAPAAWSNQTLADFESGVHGWSVTPAGTEGYEKAEVTVGGIDTDELSSKTMESRKVRGLFFIGEVVDVTGQLGGFNFQWAWASGAAAGRAL
ncbi:MAG: NAD(P)/FAD-dependent oxidoreductase [Candidatus Acidiferrales bacterium]